MESQTQQLCYRLTPRMNDNTSSWCIDFSTIDVLSRKICLTGYSGGEGLILTLPDQTTSFYIGSMSNFEPLHHHAIMEITRGHDLASMSTRRSTRLSTLRRDQFALITDQLYTFGVSREIYTTILEEISDYLRHTKGTRGGGDIDVNIWKLRSRAFHRYEDPGVDIFVDTLFRSNITTSSKPVPADSYAIGSLQVERFSRECAICIQDFEDGSKFTRLPCDHVFHGDCISNWLHINHVCPLCRKPIS